MGWQGGLARWSEFRYGPTLKYPPHFPSLSWSRSMKPPDWNQKIKGHENRRRRFEDFYKNWFFTCKFKGGHSSNVEWTFTHRPIPYPQDVIGKKNHFESPRLSAWYLNPPLSLSPHSKNRNKNNKTYGRRPGKRNKKCYRNREREREVKVGVSWNYIHTPHDNCYITVEKGKKEVFVITNIFIWLYI